jgi:hypothetical protein
MPTPVAKRQNKPGDQRRIKCFYCRHVRLCTWQSDPYMSEIVGNHTLHWQCDDCDYSSTQDL